MTQLLARDMDNDPLVFGVSGEEASRFFAVEPDTGVVWLRQPLDREVWPPRPLPQSSPGGRSSPWGRVARRLFGAVLRGPCCPCSSVFLPEWQLASRARAGVWTRSWNTVVGVSARERREGQ